MNTFGSQAPTRTRNISVICSIEEHGYCNLKRYDSCSCSCHFRDRIIGGQGAVDFAFALWEIDKDLHALEDDVRNEAILKLITSAQEIIDFNGLTATEVHERLKEILHQRDWSYSRTQEALGFI